MSKVYVDLEKSNVYVNLKDFMLWFVTHYEVEDMKIYELEYGEEWKREDIISEYLDYMQDNCAEM